MEASTSEYTVLTQKADPDPIHTNVASSNARGESGSYFKRMHALW
jgi:hypothetical protein